MKNRSLTATAILAEQQLLKMMVESLAGCGPAVDCSQQNLEPGWNAIGISSLEAYASGDINFSGRNNLLKMPFATCFLFTCIKRKGSGYDLRWASSLS